MSGAERERIDPRKRLYVRVWAQPKHNSENPFRTGCET